MGAVFGATKHIGADIINLKGFILFNFIRQDSLATDLDGDSDGIPDSAEITYGLDETTPNETRTAMGTASLILRSMLAEQVQLIEMIIFHTPELIIMINSPFNSKQNLEGLTALR